MLTYWFGPAHSEFLPNTREYFDSMFPHWFFGKSLFFDIAQRGAQELIARIAAGGCSGAAWDGPRGLLAQIIVLDQFSRCAFRGTAGAFANDALACKLSRQALDAGAYEQYWPIEKFFVCLALSHSEDVEENVLHAALGRRLGAGQPDEVADFFANIPGFPHEHEECIKRFGRFPHRNALLGRESTSEELAWLASSDCPGWAKSQGRARLTYWDARGMGDPIRFLLEFCLIPYEEAYVTTAHELATLKASGRLAFGQVPLLEMDGLRLVQTQAIHRYIAGRKGLRGNSPAEEWAADAVAAAVADARMPLITIPCQDDPAAARAKWAADALPKLCGQLEGLMQGRGGSASWVAGASLTYADICVFELLTYAKDECREAVDAQLAACPKLSELVARIGSYQHLGDFLTSGRRKPCHDDDFVRRVFAILGAPLPKYMR